MRRSVPRSAGPGQQTTSLSVEVSACTSDAKWGHTFDWFSKTPPAKRQRDKQPQSPALLRAGAAMRLRVVDQPSSLGARSVLGLVGLAGESDSSRPRSAVGRDPTEGAPRAKAASYGPRSHSQLPSDLRAERPVPQRRRSGRPTCSRVPGNQGRGTKDFGAVRAAGGLETRADQPVDRRSNRMQPTARSPRVCRPGAACIHGAARDPTLEDPGSRHQHSCVVERRAGPLLAEICVDAARAESCVSLGRSRSKPSGDGTAAVDCATSQAATR